MARHRGNVAVEVRLQMHEQNHITLAHCSPNMELLLAMFVEREQSE